MPRSFLVFLALLLAACTAPSVTNAGVTPTLAERPTSTATPRPTPTMTATSEPTLTPTPEIVLHAGIPATIEECDVLHPGTPGYEQEMRQRREADRAALVALDGKVFFIPAMKQFGDIGYLPMYYKNLSVDKNSILSCSTYQRNGERIIRFGIATSSNTVMYIDYDELAAKNYILTYGGGESNWDEVFSFENLLLRIKSDKPLSGISFGVFMLSDYRANQSFGFEGVWEFYDASLPEPVKACTNKGVEFTISDFEMLSNALIALRNLDLESRQRVLEAVEKYFWPGAFIMTTEN